MIAADVALRPTTSADAEFLRAVYASTRKQELELTGWSEEQKAEFCRQQFTAQDLHYREYYPTAQFSIIELNGTPIGRLYADRWTREIRIMDIAVLPEYRGKGIGTALLKQLLGEGAAQQKKVSIHVESFNPALRLYERLGFRRVSNSSVYCLLEWTPHTL